VQAITKLVLAPATPRFGRNRDARRVQSLYCGQIATLAAATPVRLNGDAEADELRTAIKIDGLRDHGARGRVVKGERRAIRTSASWRPARIGLALQRIPVSRANRNIKSAVGIVSR
jgi:hypothetical protein